MKNDKVQKKEHATTQQNKIRQKKSFLRISPPLKSDKREKRKYF